MERNFYLFGGSDGKVRRNDLSCYKEGTWKKIEPPFISRLTSLVPKNRTIHTLSFRPTTKELVLIGGYGRKKGLSDIWVYSLMKLSWRRLWVNNISCIYYHTASYHEKTDAIYIFGGKDTPVSEDLDSFSNFLSTLSFTPHIQYERVIYTKNIVTPPCMGRHTSIIYKNDIYIFGGADKWFGSNRKYNNDTWVFNIVNKIWHLLDVIGDKPIERCAHIAILFEDQMYVHGGYGGGKFLNSIWRLHLKLKTWTCVEYEGISPYLYAHNMEVVNSQIIIFGGLNQDGEECIDSYMITIPERKEIIRFKMLLQRENHYFNVNFVFRSRKRKRYDGKFLLRKRIY